MITFCFSFLIIWSVALVSPLIFIKQMQTVNASKSAKIIPDI